MASCSDAQGVAQEPQPGAEAPRGGGAAKAVDADAASAIAVTTGDAAGPAAPPRETRYEDPSPAGATTDTRSGQPAQSGAGAPPAGAGAEQAASGQETTL